MTDPEVVFKALGNKSRLAILGALQDGPKHVELIAERVKLAVSTVSFHLKKLREAGCVVTRREQYYVVYAIEESIMNQRISELIVVEPREEARQLKAEERYRKKVMDAFFKYGRLKSIPVQRKKRRIILEQIVQAFEEDRRYPEREVNVILADFHDDFATLRRSLIEERLLERDSVEYWLPE